MWFKRRKRLAADLSGLRDRLLASSAAELGLGSAAAGGRVWAAFLELGYPGAVVTLVALADGTTSLYFSNGGGLIGAGGHQAVEDASRLFLSSAESMVHALEPVSSTPLPELGRVRFYVRAGEAMLGAEAGEADLAGTRHDLAPLYHAGHGVITAIRETTPG